MTPDEIFKLAVRIVEKYGRPTDTNNRPGKEADYFTVWHYTEFQFSIGMVRHFKDQVLQPVDQLGILTPTDRKIIVFEVKGGQIMINEVPSWLRGRMQELFVLEDLASAS